MVDVKHTFTSPKADGVDSTLVQPSNWNASHTFTMNGDALLGRGSGSGVVTEIPCTAFARSLLDDPDAASARGTLGAFSASGGTIAGSVTVAGTLSASTVSGSVGSFTTVATTSGVEANTFMRASAPNIPIVYVNTAAASNRQGWFSFQKGAVNLWAMINDIFGNDAQTFGIYDFGAGQFRWWVNTDGTHYTTIPGIAAPYRATPYRAYVVFSGSTLAVSLSYGVSSITDRGVGRYTLNLETPLPDANYGISGTCEASSGFSMAVYLDAHAGAPSRTASAVPICTIANSTSFADAAYISVGVVR